MSSRHSYAFTDLMALARSTAGWSFDANGFLVEAGANEPRHDHDPVTLAYRGVLLESAATNLQGSSEDFGSADWTPTRVAVTSDAAAGPSGAALADRLTENTEAGSHTLNGPAVQSVTSGETYKAMVYAKGETCATFQVGLSASGFGNQSWATFDLAAGTLGSIGTNSTAEILPVRDGWYRCILTAPATGTVSTATPFLAMTPGAVSGREPSYTGTGRSFLVWGVDFRQTTLLTSYVRTGLGASAQRAADSLVLTDIARWFNHAEGTFVVDFMPGQTSSIFARGIFAVDDGTSNHFFDAFIVPANLTVQMIGFINGSPNLAQTTIGTATLLARNTLRLSYGPAGYVASLNGAAPVTVAAAVTPNLYVARLGRRRGGGSAGTELNGWIARARYYARQYTDTPAADGHTIRTR